MSWEELFKRKKFALKGYKAVPLEVNCDYYKGEARGYATTLEYFTCNHRSCYEPAIKKTATGYFCEKHLKEAKNG